MNVQKPGKKKTNGSGDRFQTIYEELRNRICVLEYPPGTKLSEEELAREFGVSRTPIRRVLGRLEAHGLVHAKHGVGNFVTEIQHETLVQIYELRKELSLLISRLSPVEDVSGIVAEIGPLMQRGKQLPTNPDIKEFARLNAEFFQLVMRLTRNEPLKEICENLYFLTTRIWVSSIPEMDLSEEIAVFLREMEEVLYALQTGDIEAAGHVRCAHISMSFSRQTNRTNRE